MSCSRYEFQLKHQKTQALHSMRFESSIGSVSSTNSTSLFYLTWEKVFVLGLGMKVITESFDQLLLLTSTSKSGYQIVVKLCKCPEFF